jgi:S1-C subfamily serine protease
MGENRTRRWRYLTVVLLVVLVMAGCSQPQPTPVPTAVPEPTPTEVVLGDDTGADTADATDAEAATPATSGKSGAGGLTTSGGGSGAVSTLADVKSAVVQIEAEGTFIDPEVGLELNAAGRGSGFIIDPEGIAVTNNHVATGAAFLKVWVAGESEPRNAKILGVSECSDLAVIDIDGDGYPYLEWYDGTVTPGLEVYAAGFPLGDPEYTLTRGIISKERADGESDWASVDYVIEHDARLNPGNSGGPLVTADGKVVGVNYAGNDADQSFAIGRSEAEGVLDELRAGQDVTSIGINGQVVASEDTTGVWVASVLSGSPADRAGIKAGVFITHLEGLLLALTAPCRTIATSCAATIPRTCWACRCCAMPPRKCWKGNSTAVSWRPLSPLPKSCRMTCPIRVPRRPPTPTAAIWASRTIPVPSIWKCRWSGRT